MHDQLQAPIPCRRICCLRTGRQRGVRVRFTQFCRDDMMIVRRRRSVLRPPIFTREMSLR